MFNFAAWSPFWLLSRAVSFLHSCAPSLSHRHHHTAVRLFPPSFSLFFFPLNSRHFVFKYFASLSELVFTCEKNLHGGLLASDFLWSDSCKSRVNMVIDCDRLLYRKNAGSGVVRSLRLYRISLTFSLIQYIYPGCI